jgi:hypothetical protein
MLNAVVGKFPIQHLREGFEHQVLISMCMVVVSCHSHSFDTMLRRSTDPGSFSKLSSIPYRPLGASHFPLCLIAAYLTAIEPAEIKELRDLLMEFQKDFASSSWLTMAMKARNSYWAARTAYANDSARETDTEAEKTFEGDDKSFCAVQ